MKKLRYLTEAAILGFFFLLFRMMNVETASALGGWIARQIGPHSVATKKAMANLRHALPEKSDAEHQEIVTAMWDNLGRIVGEYPHLRDIVMNRTEVIGESHLHDIGQGNPALFMGAHLANWEPVAFYFNYRLQWPFVSVYREPNNPYAAKLLDFCRNPGRQGRYIAKSRVGAREMIKTLKDGDFLGQLIDQKYNQGIAVPFLGRPAMTSTAFVSLARKFDAPLVLFRMQRLPKCRFKLIFHTPIKVGEQDDFAALSDIHETIESWIREYPGQWLWLHRRWDSKAVMDQRPEL